MPIAFSAGNNENTMDTAAGREADNSFRRLRRRYPNIDFAQCYGEICFYLRHNGDQNDFFDWHVVAQRAIFPGFGAVGLNRVRNPEMVAYYWMAANEENQDEDNPIFGTSTTERRQKFVQALYECQRGNNAVDPDNIDMTHNNSSAINFEDNLSLNDAIICGRGVINKFAELFNGIHPDVRLSIDINLQIFDLVRGFIAEYCYSRNITYQQLVSGTLSFNTTLDADVKNTIKNKVIEILGDASVSVNGLMQDIDLRYLEETLGVYLEYLAFNSVRNTTMTSQEVDECILSARMNLAEARALRADRTTRGLENIATTPDPVFDFDAISAIILGELTQPTNTAGFWATGDADYAAAMRAQAQSIRPPQVKVVRLRRARCQGI